jgi:hypothetical protein
MKFSTRHKASIVLTPVAIVFAIFGSACSTNVPSYSGPAVVDSVDYQPMPGKGSHCDIKYSMSDGTSYGTIGTRNDCSTLKKGSAITLKDGNLQRG